MKPKSPRPLPGLKSPRGCCFTEVNPEALLPKLSMMEMAILGPGLLPMGQASGRPWQQPGVDGGCPKQDESAFSWEVTPAQGHFSQT